jgi:3-dehydroquinate synthase
MKKLTISLPSIKERTYPIHIGTNLFEKLPALFDFSKYTKIFVITDTNVEGLFLKKLLKNLPDKTSQIILPPGEKAKDINHLTKIWKEMVDSGLDRNSIVINLGGGVIGDIGGFAASTYMRGIDFINIPTTILSQVDESVGGKTMIDFNEIKNIIGTFHQPSAVFIDIETIKTLPERQVLSGFAEIIKHGIIKDKAYFDFVTKKHPLEFTDAELIETITKSCEIKAQIVQNDEKEKGERKLLNFGHTIGHAIEAISLETPIPLLHGEAISIGMVFEAKIALKTGLLYEDDAKIIKQKLRDAGLPTELPNFSAEEIIKKMKSDKKNVGETINFTLVKRIGEGVVNQTVSEETIKEMLTEK